MDPGFKAEATEPSAQTTLSLMSVSVNTYAYSPVTELHVYEYGTFTGNIEDVDQTTGLVSLSIYYPGFAFPEIPLNFTFNMDGTWSAYCELDPASLGTEFAGGLVDFDLDISNYLVAEPMTQGGTAMIQKLGGKVVFPEPATLLLAVCGLAMISLRRP
jgi:hypothetical protein